MSAAWDTVGHIAAIGLVAGFMGGIGAYAGYESRDGDDTSGVTGKQMAKYALPISAIGGAIIMAGGNRFIGDIPTTRLDLLRGAAATTGAIGAPLSIGAALAD